MNGHSGRRAAPEAGEDIRRPRPTFVTGIRGGFAPATSPAATALSRRASAESEGGGFLRRAVGLRRGRHDRLGAGVVRGLRCGGPPRTSSVAIHRDACRSPQLASSGMSNVEFQPARRALPTADRVSGAVTQGRWRTMSGAGAVGASTRFVDGVCSLSAAGSARTHLQLLRRRGNGPRRTGSRSARC